MIRLAHDEDIAAVMGVYEAARYYMAQNGNVTQWSGSYPQRDMLLHDIACKQLFVDTDEAHIHGVFAFIIGPDPTYAYIEGAWKNDKPYGTIHRLAADGVVKGIFSRCLEFCKSKISDLRIDTHQDNHTMQYLIEKNGFEKCGVIYVNDGSPRIAYQYVSRNGYCGSF